ncbi:MAG: hypothetical protein RR382_00595 [Tannerellaceae bacterium]
MSKNINEVILELGLGQRVQVSINLSDLQFTNKKQVEKVGRCLRQILHTELVEGDTDDQKIDCALQHDSMRFVNKFLTVSGRPYMLPSDFKLTLEGLRSAQRKLYNNSLPAPTYPASLFMDWVLLHKETEHTWLIDANNTNDHMREFQRAFRGGTDNTKLASEFKESVRSGRVTIPYLDERVWDIVDWSKARDRFLHDNPEIEIMQVDNTTYEFNLPGAYE